MIRLLEKYNLPGKETKPIVLRREGCDIKNVTVQFELPLYEEYKNSNSNLKKLE